MIWKSLILLSLAFEFIPTWSWWLLNLIFNFECSYVLNYKLEVINNEIKYAKMIIMMRVVMRVAIMRGRDQYIDEWGDDGVHPTHTLTSKMHIFGVAKGRDMVAKSWLELCFNSIGWNSTYLMYHSHHSLFTIWSLIPS